jgi:dihydroflavonol-4-reductase
MNPEVTEYSDLCAKPALVAGATGFVGGHTIRALLAQGRPVRAMVRATSDLSSLEGLDVDLYYGDVSDQASLEAAMQGCGSVFYSVVDARSWLSDPSVLFRTNVDGLANAIAAAKNTGIKRFIFTSSMVTIGVKGKNGGPSDETVAFDWGREASPYPHSRVDAENLLLAACREEGFPGIAMCVANTYGPQDYLPTPHGKSLRDAAFGRLPAALKCSAPTVDIRDTADAMLLAERYGRLGERYIVANEYVSQERLYALASAELGNSPPKLMTMRTAYAMATINEIVSWVLRRKDQLFCRSSMKLSEVFTALDNSKARNELGWNPRAIEDTVKDAVAWFSANQRTEQP